MAAMQKFLSRRVRRAASAEHGDETHAPVHPLADDADALAHRESRGYRPGAEAAHLAEEAEGQRRRHRETYHVERNFYLRVRNARDLGELAREEVRGDYRHFTAVRERDAEAEQNTEEQAQK